ncbi:MAG: carboxypeptidase-like regulatory domain-containing protein, partial [Bacteroidales bacterium]|nr:carboxypeptidase-like regulatory domain-containing protein [Bacteroidales bacterium]
MKRIYLLLTLALTLFSVHSQVQFFNPPALEATLNMGDSAVLTTVLHNYGSNPLEFDFPEFSSKGSGGPDEFGYTWIDSDDPNGLDWAWTEISETGTLVEGLMDDNVVGPFLIGFDFPFYGQNKIKFWINSNGCISFNSHQVTYANHPIPTNNNNVDFIAWFWDDLTMDSVLSRVYYKKIEHQMIVQFDKIVHYPGTEEWITAQVIMKQDGTILIRYKQIREGFDVESATVGLQSHDKEIGLQVVYNAPYLHSELALRFDLNRNFVTAVNPASGLIPTGGQETIYVTYSAAGFQPGSYEQDVKCLTSHPEYPEIFLHNVMHVVNPYQAGFKGYVTDAATGFAIAEVQVKTSVGQTYTNANGYYELPLEHGNYTVKFIRNGYHTLIIEDTAAMPGYSILDVQLSGFYLIAGQVFADENHIESGFAYCYKMLDGTVVDVYAGMVGGQGWYEFSGLSVAHYIIKSEPSPNSVYYGSYLPTYYGDVLHWEDATIIHLTAGTEQAHINLVPVISGSPGPGSISGKIENQGDAMSAANIPVILRSLGSSGAHLTYSSTDGTFLFSGL